MIKITSSEEFENIIKNIEQRKKNIEEIFQNENQNIEKINETEIWSGDTQGVIYQKYKELSMNYDPIIESLKTYIDLLKKTVNDYKSLEGQIENNASNNSEQLNVNS